MRAGHRAALRRRAEPGGHRAPRLRARRHRRDGVRRLLPHRLGLREVRQGQRHRRGTRPRFRRRVHRQLRAGHHRHRPAQVRPAVRALPQPGAQEHARHRHGLQRRPAQRSHRLRGAEVRPGQGGADHHLRHHGRARGRARRRARHGQALRDRRQDRQDDPRAGAAGDLRRRDEAERRAQAGLRRRRGGQGGRRPRHEPRGPHPQRLHPRGRRGDQRQAAHRVPAAAAEGRGRARHAVRHERRLQARPAQDGLPRPAQPGRHRGRARHHRADARRLHRDRPAAARRREDLQDARPRRLHRRLPVREPRHEGGAARDRPHRVRGPHRHRGALPAGSDAVHPDVRAQQEGPGLGRLRPRGAAPHPGAHPRRDHLPGAVHGHRPPGRRVQPGAGGRPAQGHQQEEPQADGHPQGAPHAGPRREGRAAGGGQQDVGELRSHRRLLVQQEPRRLLRDDQLPHRVAQGELPRRVHGGPGLERHEHQGQGAVLRQPVPRDGHRGAAAGRQHQSGRVHRGRGQDPLRHERREGRRRRRHRGHRGRAGRGRALRVDLRLLRPRRLADGQQARARGAHPQRRVRQHRRPAPRHARGGAAGDVRRGAQAQGQGAGPGRPLRRDGRGRGQRASAACGAADRVGPDDAAALREGGPRPVRLRAPAAGPARAAARRDRGAGQPGSSTPATGR